MTIILPIILYSLFFLLPQTAHAATVSWDGGASTTEWNTANNWSNNVVPTSDDDVTIDNAAVVATTTAINFSTLTIGSGTNTTSLTPTVNIGTGGSITINNAGTLTQNNKVQQTISGTLTINSGGNLTHTANTTANTYNVNFSAATITINGTGTINVNAKGYSGGNGTGGNTSGASHGGVGNGGSATYDSVTNPTDLGSGGGSSVGGGLVSLTVSGTITVTGTISATGGNSGNGGGAAGGTINITAGTFTGTGSITAGGGSGVNTGGGAGGRIAIKYNTDTSSLTALHTAGNTGNAAFPGGPGTVYKATQAGASRTLIIDNNSVVIYNNGAEMDDYTIPLDSIILRNRGLLHIKSGSTMTIVANQINNGSGSNSGILSNDGTLILPSSYTLDNYTLWANLAGTISGLTDLTIGSTGILSHAYNTTTRATYLNLSLNSININSGGKIDVIGKGYRASGLGASSAGASHGGVGNGGVATYGSVTNPTDLGSGGGTLVGGFGTTQGAGGGIIILNIAGTLTVTGTITATGGDHSNGGSGAGGSINITTGTLTGTGSIVSTGGTGTNSGGGSGGRIAIYYNTDTSSLTALHAAGGTGNAGVAFYGGAGTVYKATQAGASRTLIVDNNTLGSTNANGAELDNYATTFDSIILKRQGILHIPSGKSMTLSTGSINNGAGDTTGILSNDGTLVLPSSYTLDGYTLWPGLNGTISGVTTLTVGSTGIISHAPNTTTKTYYINLSVANLTINSGGSINVNGKGYSAGNGPGTACAASNGVKGGAAHGGNGGIAGHLCTGAQPNTYGSVTNPTDLGSGSSVAGGGLVILTISGTLTMNGTISSNSATPAGNQGGGSGGSINITTGTFAGSGTITSNGGAYTGGCCANGNGAGGRIAIKYNTDNSSLSTLGAFGANGGGSQAGGPGTIYKATQAGASRTLIIDNNDSNSYNSGAELDDYSQTFDSMVLQNAGNLHIKSGSSMTVTANLINNGVGDATGILSNDGTLTLPSSYTLDGFILWPNAAGTVSGLTNLTIGSTGTLSHGYNTTTKVNYINLSLTSLTINSGGTINLTNKGYSAGNGPGVQTCTASNGTKSGPNHGGMGGKPGLGCNTGTLMGANDSFTNPTDLGSTQSNGSLGAGAVILNISGTFTLNGTINANGSQAGNTAGGTGGTINLTAGTFAGSGSMTANGGAGDAGGGCCGNGGGGGGRISINLTTNTFTGTATSTGGGGGSAGAEAGTNGTIYWGNASFTNVAVAAVVPSTSSITGVKTITFWVKPTSTTTNFLKLASGVEIGVAAGTLTTSGITSPTTYINGSAGGTITSGSWNHVSVTTGTGITADNVTLGQNSGGYLSGQIDDVRFYTSEYSSSQVSSLYTQQNSIDSNISTTSSAEEYAPATPVSYWKLDDATGTTAKDTTTTANNGTLGGTTLPTWQGEDQCISGKCLYFDGTSSKVTAANSANGIQAVSFWVKPKTTTQGLVQLASGYSVSASAGVVSTAGFSNPNIYVNGVLAGGPANINVSNARVIANQWNHITVTTTTSFTANSILLGQASAVVLNGYMDEIKIYDFALSSAQVKAAYVARGTAQGASAVLGIASNNNYSVLNQGLLGYWKFDESSGDAADSSGNSLTLTNNNTTTYTGGKFGNGPTFNGTTQYFNTSTSATGVKTVAFWVKPAVLTNNYVNLTSSIRVTSNSSGTVAATGFTSPSVYVNGTLNGTLTASTWNHVVITTSTAITANQIYVGRASTSYLSSGSLMDEVRFYNRTFTLPEITQLVNFAPGPVAYYNFDENTGSTVNDKSGNANTGTWNGSGSSHWKPGKNGAGGNFDGSSDYVEIADNNSLDPTVITVSLWVKPTNLTSSPVLVGHGDNSTGWYVQFQSSTGKIWFCTIASCQLTTNGVLTAGSWQHLLITHDGINNKYYINGNLTDTIAETTAITNYAGTLRFGHYSSGSTYFTGSIDDVKVYNYARTQQQIVEDMTNGSDVGGSGYTSASSSTSGSIAKPVGYWKFDEGYSTTANNYGNGGTALNGTLTGMSSPATSTSGWTQSGKVNKALIFDGSNDTVTVSNATMPGDSYSISVWFKATSSANTLFSMGDHSVADQVLNFTSNKLSAISYYSSSANSLTANSTVSTGVWHHAVLVRDSGTQKLTIYLDGNQDGSTAISSTTANYGTTKSYDIGNRGSVGAYFTGTVDEVKIYPYALTVDQVKLDMNQGSAQILGALGNNTNYAANSANQEYCIPGDSSACNPPVGRWDFEEGTGTSANDKSGNANTGTLTSGPTWVNGKSGNGKALNFDDTNDYVSLGSPSSLALAQFTIEGWIKPTALSGYQLIYGLTNMPKLYTTGTSLQLYDGSVNPTASTTLQANVWQYIVVTHDQVNTKFYINGVPAGTTANTTAYSTVASTTTIGKDPASGSQFFPGQIDQVRIFNYARSAAQIAWDYNKGAPVGHWRMDECQGTSATDVSGNANTGTITIGASGTQTTAGTCTDGLSTSAWANGKTGKRNYSLNFDGTDDNISVSNTISGVQSVGFWVKPSSSTANMLALTGSAYISASSGTISATGFTSPTIYVNGIPGTILTANTWNHIVVTTATGISASAINIGLANGVYLNGQLDDARVYNYPLTSTQVKTLFSEGAYRSGPSTGAP